MLGRPRSGTRLLRTEVYDYLQEQMRTGAMEPGSAISVKKMLQELGISRTPLREALLILQEQGFVTIMPQRGVVINALSLEDIKNIYEILGGIESKVVLSVFDRLGPEQCSQLETLNTEMEAALAAGDIDLHNRKNIAFHDVFLQLSNNERLLNYVANLKMQLYDFPKRDYGAQWNEKNLEEHRIFLELIRSNKALAAADYLRDVHWEFTPPDAFTIITS